MVYQIIIFNSIKLQYCQIQRQKKHNKQNKNSKNNIRLRAIINNTRTQHQTLFMNSPISTVQNSNNWKLWHSINYIIGGITFFFGSILLFPFFNDYVNAAAISGWLYTIGSLTFLLADTTQWLHYIHSDCKYLIFAINFFVNIIGSSFYLLGSICFIHQVNKPELGMFSFITGSFFIMVAQVWKLIRTFYGSKQSFNQIYEEDTSGIWVDFFAGAGALMYFSGTFVFQKAGDNVQLIKISAFIYTMGGFFFFVSGCMVIKRYFWEETNLPFFAQQEIY